jgi:hypothetical protein
LPGGCLYRRTAAFCERISIMARWDDEAGKTTVEVSDVELTEPYAVLLAEQATEQALAWVNKAIQAQKGPETGRKRPRRAEVAISGAFPRTDISIYEQLAERAGFEPAMEFNPHTRLAGECLQPLGHLSLGSDGQCKACPVTCAQRRTGTPRSIRPLIRF